MRLTGPGGKPILAMRTGLVRLTFAKLFTPVQKTNDDKTPMVDAEGKPVMQWQTGLIIPKHETETLRILREIMTEAARGKWGDKVPAGCMKGLRDGNSDEAALLDPLDPSKGVKEELKDCFWINANSSIRPKVFNNEKDEFTNAFKELTQDEIKSGDWVRVQLNVFAYDTPKKKGIGFGFNGVQLIKVGEALATGREVNMAAFDDDTEMANAFGS